MTKQVFNTITEKLSSLWEVLRVLLSVAILIGLGVYLYHKFVPSPDTYGSILVDSPEVYTRERLVNDRFLQDAWLKSQLEEVKTFTGADSYLEARQSINASLDKSSQNNGDETGDSASPSGRLSISTEDLFVDMAEYRDRVRSYKIENQLDDRHDLNGNTLYRLKFDATIIPGTSTRLPAKIEVRLNGPRCIKKPNDKPAESPGSMLAELLGDKEKVEQLREVYRRWLLNLQGRLNQTHREQKQAFYNNEFKKPDYTRIKNFFATYHDIDLSDLDECKPPKDDAGLKAKSGNHPLDVYDINHPDERTCVRSIVHRLIKNERTAKKNVNPKPKEYNIPRGEYETGTQPVPKGDCEPTSGSKRNNIPHGEYVPIKELKVSQDLEKHLNTFLASKTLQLVLGIKIPQSEFQQNDLYQLSQLEPLSKISFFRSELKSTGYKVFVVQERLLPITAINPSHISDQALMHIIKKLIPGNIKGYRPSWTPGRKVPDNIMDPCIDFCSGASLTTPSNKLPRREECIKILFEPLNRLDSEEVGAERNIWVWKDNADTLRREEYEIWPDEFNEVKQGSGEFAAQAKVGLFNFFRHARDQNNTYAYAVTPKMRAVSQFATLEHDTKAGGGLPGLGDIQVRADRSAVTRTINRKGTTVGFGSSSGKEEAVFGWIISPRLSVADSEDYVHAPAQTSLTALVSLPSWWNKVRLTVKTNWVGRDGVDKKGHGMESKIEYSLDLPANYEQLEAEMLQLQQLGPELMESMLDPIRLTACKGGAIVIPGRRLWRSTVVTLGYQTADEISVLPNMKGIIARFNIVENQMSVAEEKALFKDEESGHGSEINRSVRIWTSQGTIALPEPAMIGISKSCRDATRLKQKKGK